MTLGTIDESAYDMLTGETYLQRKQGQAWVEQWEDSEQVLTRVLRNIRDDHRDVFNQIVAESVSVGSSTVR